MSKLIVSAAAVPQAVSNAIAATLRGAGLELSPELLSRIAANVCSGLVDLDESLSTASQPSLADRFTTGMTLRSLAHCNHPNPDTAKVLGRVGEWLLAGAELRRRAA